MALSTMRLAMRPMLKGSQSVVYFSPMIREQKANMATAQDEMKEFWEKNQRLGRPSSPWTIYKPHLPMATSLTHRVTGVVMGVSLYGISMGLGMAPGDFATYIEFVKGFELSPAVMFPVKFIAAFPLCYHYLNGIRHLAWDAGKGLELDTQYQTGKIVFASAFSLAAFLASLSYWAL